MSASGGVFLPAHLVCWVGMASQYVTSFVVDKFMGGAVLKDVVAFCLSNDSLRVIEDFMMANACFFTKDEEHKLVYTELRRQALAAAYWKARDGSRF